MLFNKETGKLVGLILADPLGDQANFCISARPWRRGSTASYENPFWYNGCALWEDLFETCHIVCPD